MVVISQSRESLSCTTILEEVEWQSLYCHIDNETKIAKEPPTVKEVIIWIEKLGGFLARKNDRNQGIRCLWKGLKRLYDISSS